MKYITEKQFNNLEKRVSVLEGKISDNGRTEIFNKGSKTILEFLKEKNIKDDTERVSCIVYFLNCIKNLDGVSSKDVENTLKNANQKIPSNLPDCLYRIVKNSFIEKCERKEGRYILYRMTKSGIKQIENLTKEI